MQTTPRTESQSRVSPMAPIIFSQYSMKVLPVALIPNTSLTCDVTMIRAAADVNPEETGPDMKSITNPSPRIPISSMTHPVIKQRRIA